MSKENPNELKIINKNERLKYLNLIDDYKQQLAELKTENKKLQEQLKNAIPQTIYFIGGKHWLSDEELKNKDFLEVKELDVVDVLNDCISKKGGFIDLVFDTREEAEQGLKKLGDKNER